MPVNEQVTDSVTQVNTATIASTPAMGMGNLLMSTSQAMATSALNATGGNQQGGIVMQSVGHQLIHVNLYSRSWPWCRRNSRKEEG
jgi:hypothetical protein